MVRILQVCFTLWTYVTEKPCQHFEEAIFFARICKTMLFIDRGRCEDKWIEWLVNRAPQTSYVTHSTSKTLASNSNYVIQMMESIQGAMPGKPSGRLFMPKQLYWRGRISSRSTFIQRFSYLVRRGFTDFSNEARAEKEKTCNKKCLSTICSVVLWLQIIRQRSRTQCHHLYYTYAWLMHGKYVTTWEPLRFEAYCWWRKLYDKAH